MIWHTQWSWKSLTMLFTATKLRKLAKLANPKVFVVVDRVDLNKQIGDTFSSCGVKDVKVIRSRKDLAAVIKSDERNIFVTTIQKAGELGKDVMNESDNIIVLIDEAHREDEGETAIRMRAANAQCFLFLIHRDTNRSEKSQYI